MSPFCGYLFFHKRRAVRYSNVLQGYIDKYGVAQQVSTTVMLSCRLVLE